MREQWEYDTAKLPNFKLFPLSQASNWSQNIEDQLDPDTETVVLCHHGMRSMQMAGVSHNGTSKPVGQWVKASCMRSASMHHCSGEILW